MEANVTQPTDRGMSLQWCHNEHDGISNHQPHHCLLNSLFRHRSQKTSKLRVTGLCEGNSPVTGEFPTQMASNVENVSIWWRHHDGCSYKHHVVMSHECLDRVQSGVLLSKASNVRGERENKFISLLGDRRHRGPYKPCNHILYIGIIIFPHIDNPQSTGYN